MKFFEEFINIIYEEKYQKQKYLIPIILLIEERKKQ